MPVSKDKFFEIIDTGREDNKWDFKKEFNISKKGEFYEFLKDALAFTNSGGGYLLLGVEDKTHQLVGVSSIVDEAELGEKIETTLGFSLDVKVLFFEHLHEGGSINLGLIYIPNSKKVRVSPKDFTGEKNVIIQSNVIYVRRNTRSIRINGEELEQLLSKAKHKGEFQFSEHDIRIIERNKSLLYLHNQLIDLLKGKYTFTALNFADKLHQIYINQTKYNKMEFATLIGLEQDKIHDYFEGKAFPKLEQILRSTKIFDLATDFFFQPTYNLRYPIWRNPLVNYCIIEKVTNKQELFKIDEGDLFYEVFWQLGKSMVIFHDWIFSEYNEPQNNEDDIFYIPPRYDFLNQYVSKLSKEKITEFKKHLSVQHYKILQVAGYGNKENSELMPAEMIIQYLLGSDDEFICRILNESIGEITIHGKNIEVDFHFFEEVKKLMVRGREYNPKTVSLEFTEAGFIE